ncbi:MAG: hypothetical protein RLZZ444_2666 [Pseudomonadota bacterium]|jgi:branched-chain amino acid transport system substrate-binding protein
MLISPAKAADQPVIAVVAPTEGNFAILGNQIRDGASLAAGKDVTLVTIAESCEPGSGLAIAEKIVEAGARAAIGFLCTESLESALPRLAEAKIPALTLSVRSPVLMAEALKNGWPFFRLAPRPEQEMALIEDTILKLWKDKPFALIDDGSILSRETVETLRESLEAKGMKPMFVDTYRAAQETQMPLVRRLAKAGVTHVFVAGDRNDMAIITRDAASAALGMHFLGGDAVNGADQPVPLTPGTLAVILPGAETIASAQPLVLALAKEGRVAEGYVIPAHAAIRILIDAIEIADGSGAPLADAMVGTPFDTALGSIMFGKDHALASNPFQLLEWDGKAFVSPKVSN